MKGCLTGERHFSWNVTRTIARACYLTGSSRSIETAKTMIENTIKASKSELHTHEMKIPGILVARVIGKGGEVIKALQEDTGARAVVLQDSRE